MNDPVDALRTPNPAVSMPIVNSEEKERLYQLGLEAFNSRRFYEAHEFWEEVWLHTPRPDKTFLQGLIQVAAAFHHYSRANAPGTRSLLRKGLLKLNGFPDSYAGIELEALRAEVRGWLMALPTGKPKAASDFPTIQGHSDHVMFRESLGAKSSKADAEKSAALRPSPAGRRGRP
jgi:hypothetical protein